MSTVLFLQTYEVLLQPTHPTGSPDKELGLGSLSFYFYFFVSHDPLLFPGQS